MPSPSKAPPPQRLHIVGAGWAGLSAAIHATLMGWEVSIYEASAQAGGRAREIVHHGRTLDNGQHLLLGAYRDTLKLMTVVGVDAERVLSRFPLHLCDAKGQGLRLANGGGLWGLIKAVANNSRWRGTDRFSLVGLVGFIMIWRLLSSLADRLSAQGLDMSVKRLCSLASQRVMRDLVEPLCLAALNTPAHEASARVFVRVLVDAFSNLPQSCDFLLPRVTLSDILVKPAVQWLQSRGAIIHFGYHVQSLRDIPLADNEPVILATSAWQASHLTREVAPSWSNCASELTHYPIATVYVSVSLSNPPLVQLDPVVMLETSARAPAQFAIQTHFLTPDETSDETSDQTSGQTSDQRPEQTHPSIERPPIEPPVNSKSGEPQRIVWAFVVSDSRGLSREELTERVLAQARDDLGLLAPRLESCIIEKRATFAPLVGLRRPPLQVATGIWACGDYVLGPYPSTLEGAVLSGKAVIEALSG